VLLVVALKTNVYDLTGLLSLQEATATNFAMNVEPEIVIPKVMKEMSPAIVNDVAIDGNGMSGGVIRCRTEVITVNKESVVHIETGAVTGKGGAVVAMYDENMTFISQVSLNAGGVNGFDVISNTVMDPIWAGGKGLHFP